MLLACIMLYLLIKNEKFDKNSNFVIAQIWCTLYICTHKHKYIFVYHQIIHSK